MGQPIDPDDFIGYTISREDIAKLNGIYVVEIFLIGAVCYSIGMCIYLW